MALETVSLDDLAELAPLLRRTVQLEPSGLVRVRRSSDRLSALVRLPFGVLAARTVQLVQGGSVPDGAPEFDHTVRAAELLAWMDGERADPPPSRDGEWRGGSPPMAGWCRIDTVPDSEVRPLVRAGALTLDEAAEREGVPGAQPRAEVAEALLDSIVLTVSDDTHSVPITLRVLSAVVRLGFVPAGSYIAIDVVGRWARIAAAYGSVFAERPGAGLKLL